MLKESRVSILVAYSTMILLAILVIVPVIWAFSLAFRANDEIVRMRGFGLRTFVPAVFTLKNFASIVKNINLFGVFKNTLFVALSVTFGSVVLNTLAGYAFARIDFFGKKFLFALILATLMIPIEILVIPLYDIVIGLGLQEKMPSVILPFVAGGLGIFLMRQFYLGIPDALEESARIDGCGHFRTFFYIFFPLSRSPVITLSLIAFLSQWDSFMIPITFLHRRNMQLLQVALTSLAFQEFLIDVGMIFAGVIISSVPIIIIFISLQKYYVAGIATTGIKG